MEDRADDKSGPKGNAGAHDRQSQVEEHEHEPHATEYHQEEGQFPKVDAKGHRENLVSENLQSKKYNRLMERWSMVAIEEKSQSPLKRTYADVASPLKAGSRWQECQKKRMVTQPYATIT